MTLKIGFVTDSTCDLPPDILQKYDIRIAPCFVIYGNESYADDGKQLVREQYYRDLPSMNPFPTTATMPPALAEEIIGGALADYDHLFVIAVASKLSGVYNTMRLAATKLAPDRITLIDSQNVSLAMGFQVLIGAETAAATGNVEQVRDAILRVRENARLFAALETMEFLRRSGRVGWAAASVGALLQIKPLFSVYDGEVKPTSRVRTFGRALEELIRLAQDQAPLDRMGILYVTDRDGAVALRDRVADFAPPETLIVSVTPTIGSHVGTGGLGIVTVSQSWRA